MLYKFAICSCILLLIAQATWTYFDNPLIYTYTDGLFKCGILYVLSRTAKKESYTYFIILDFFFQLSIIDYLYDIVLNPYVIHTSQFYLFILVILVFIVRILCHFTGVNLKTLAKKILK